MEFTPNNTISSVSTNIVEVRTYILLQELNSIEADENRNNNTIDNVSSERDEQTGGVTATVVIPCQVRLQSGLPQLTINNPYDTTENIPAAFYESAFAQWLGEQSLINNPTQTKYIQLAQTYIPRSSLETGGNNATVTFTFTNLPTTKEIQGVSISVRGTDYLQGVFQQ
ncbi:hypothetical protein [Okeania sp. KiyG1]|uniref:hypothetical protein n=1 Tax=Okeania sp. KiyG1 TaxID=2720165 RepID=UPI0019221584|nr:hypothetical protein [Okeania sp. KiyG1]GGA53260.1 hypothetical protein CYANOKiyG1_73330 [Okeania sp. KiyG1]